MDDCTNGPNACNTSVPCVLDPATCASGLAEWTASFFFCPEDTPKGAIPNGGGEHCYDSFASCLGGPNACGLSVPCEYSTSLCSTGQAAGALSANWFCPAVVPLGATHNGAGERCYDSIANCASAPNRCDSSSCYMNNATCSSGISAGLGTVVFCDQTQPPGAIPNGAGMLCYNESSWCLLGPNACGVSSVPGAIVVGGATLSNGTQLGGAVFNGSAVLLGTLAGNGSVVRAGQGVVGCVSSLLYADTNFSVGLVTACPVNGSLVSGGIQGEALGTAVGAPVYNGSNLLGVVDPAGSGHLYSVKAVTAPGGYTAPPGSIVGSVVMNATSGGVLSVFYGAVACQLDVVTCSSGQAGPAPNSWFCETDYPAGSVANGAGQLCYLTAEACVGGPNACGAAQPCSLDTATCATGAGAGLGFNYYCSYSTPLGGIPAGSGQLCFDSYDHCMNAPNACNPNSTFQGAFNPAFNCTQRTDLCATGQAAGSGATIVCPADVPGAALTTANTSVGTPWSLLPLSGAPPTALPHGGGSYCFATMDDCTNALNACNSSVTCVVDVATCATGLAEWSSNVWTCPLDLPTGAVPNGGVRHTCARPGMRLVV